MQHELSTDQIVDILDERARRFNHEEIETDEDLVEMIIFSQASCQYAIPLGMLSEIRIVSRITQLPMVSQSILGVVNVRGRIVSVYALSDAIGKNIDKGFVLVGYGKAAHVALLAEDIVGTEYVSTNEIKETPISLKGKEFITGVSSEGMIFLDLDKFITNKKLYMA